MSGSGLAVVKEEPGCSVYATLQTVALYCFSVHARELFLTLCQALNVLFKMPESLRAAHVGMHHNQGSSQLGGGLKIMRRHRWSNLSLQFSGSDYGLVRLSRFGFVAMA
eukprot:EG_transcript_17973